MPPPQFGTEDFDLQNASQQAIEKIMDEDELTERGFRIEEVAWQRRIVA
jgi:hypothetical protein